MEILMLNYLKDADRLLAAAGWATRSAKCAAEYEPSEKEVRDMVKYSKEMKLSSVLDIPFFVFSLKDVSRSFTHQWVRYRIAAHMQQSLRFVNVSTDRFDWFVVPPSISKLGTRAVADYVKSQLNAAGTYRNLLKLGVPAEDARFALPIGTKTHITTAMNAEELLHVITQRCCSDAQWEIRTVSYALLTAGMIIAPMLFDGSGPYCVSEGVCRGSSKGKCRACSEETLGKLRKIVDEKRLEFDSMEIGSWLEADLTSILGYSAPRELRKDVKKDVWQEVQLDVPVMLKIRK